MLLLVKSNWTYPTALINALNENYWFCYCCYFCNKLSFHLANLIFNSLIFYYYRDYQIYLRQKDRWHQSGNYIELRFIWDNQIICSQSQLSRQRVQRVSRGESSNKSKISFETKNWLCSNAELELLICIKTSLSLIWLAKRQ